MKNYLTVFKFEYSGYIKSKAYIMTTIIILAVILIASFIPQFSNLFTNMGGDSDGAKAAYVLNDKTGQNNIDEYVNKETLKSVMPDFSWEEADTDADPKKLINDEGYSLVTVYEGNSEFKLYGSGSDLSATSYQPILQEFFTEIERGLAAAQMDPQMQAGAVDVLSIQAQGEFISVGGNDGDAWGNYWIAYFLVFLLYMVVSMYGQFVVTSVATEKSSRAMELLITSAKPAELMFGKVIGVGCVALTQIVLIVLTLFVCIRINLEGWKEFAPSIFEIMNSTTFSPGLIAAMIVFFILGYFIYAFMYAALGSTVSKVEEASNVVALPIFLLVASFLISMWSITNIESPVAVVLSYVPYFSQFVMFNRFCMGTAGLIEVSISVAILIVTMVLVGHLAAKIYRMGVLMYGKPMSLKNIIKTMF